MDPRTRDQLLYEANRKSTGLSYVLWLFFGFFGIHRFYLGKTGSGVAQLLLSLTVIGLIPMAFWWLIDAFLIPDMVRDQNLKTINLLSGGVPGGVPGAAPGVRTDKLLGAPSGEDPQPGPRRSLDPRVEEIRAMRRR